MKSVMGIIYTNKDDLSLRELTSQRSVAALPLALPALWVQAPRRDALVRRDESAMPASTFPLSEYMPQRHTL